MSCWETSKEVLVCLGTGGVGKTTVSAALALDAAARGRRVLVMTIDPARRLFDAFGLGDTGNQAHEVRPDAFAAAGLTLPKGALHVCMPDVRGTFDTLVRRWAPSAAASERILTNRVYRHFSSALAGSHEYAAVESLYEMQQSGRYDLIVLDTPPSQNATAFLQAPERVVDFLGSDAPSWLVKTQAMAGKLTTRLVAMGSSFIFKGLGKVAGAETLTALVEFVQSFAGMYEGFVQRAAHVRALLGSQKLGYILVGAPATTQLDSLLQFCQDLRTRQYTAHGAIINRVRLPVPENLVEGSTQMQRILDALPPPQAAAIASALGEHCRGAQQDGKAVAYLRAGGLRCPIQTLPDIGPRASLPTLVQHLRAAAAAAPAAQ